MKLLLIKKFTLCGGLLCAFLLFSTSQIYAKTKKQYFNQLQIDTGITVTHQIEVANFIEGDGNEIFILGVTKEGTKKALIFDIDLEKQSYLLISNLNIPINTVAYDFLTDNNNIVKMLLLDDRALSILDFNNSEIKKLSDISSIYLTPQPKYLAKKVLVSDFNNDKLDDIFISSFTKTHFLLQQNNGIFSTFSLPIRAIVDMNNNHISYSETKLFSVDSNFDEKNDIVVVGENKLVVYEQITPFEFNQMGKINELPMTVSPLPWWLLRTSDGEAVDQSSLEHRMLEILDDINNDGLTDIMIRYTRSTGVFDRGNIYEVYYGSNVNGKLTFSSAPDTSITASGTLTGLKLLNVYNDSRKEILVSSFDIGITQIIGALLSGSVDQDVYIFKLDDNDQFIKKPLFSEDVELSFSLSSGSRGKPVILPLNLKGNSNQEVMLSSGENRLTIYESDNNKKFNRSKNRQKINLPKDGSMLISGDYNNDGINEVYVRYGKQDAEIHRTQIKILSTK